MTQHTQGPWHATYDKRRDNYSISAGLQKETSMLIAFTRGESVPANQEANARLIASAPELLEALELVQAIAKSDRKKIEGMGFDFKTMGNLSEWATAKIDAAIAKAKGV